MNHVIRTFVLQVFSSHQNNAKLIIFFLVSCGLVHLVLDFEYKSFYTHMYSNRMA